MLNIGPLPALPCCAGWSQLSPRLYAMQNLALPGAVKAAGVSTPLPTFTVTEFTPCRHAAIAPLPKVTVPLAHLLHNHMHLQPRKVIVSWAAPKAPWPAG